MSTGTGGGVIVAVCWGVQEERQRGQVHGQSAASSGQGRERPFRALHQESLKQASFPYREIIIRHVNSVGGGGAGSCVI